ncbi:N-acetylneuraminate lyase [Georgenia halophila]|uniref:N-acetylneuraminate lyase n=1 Tax=Georgenia halophila TaxID=620889 RepID=A0ABP8KVA1_9MICO
MSRLEIWAAVPTPFDDEGRLDTSVVPRQAAHLRATGVRGAFVCGTTGEFPALSVRERLDLVRAWSYARPEGLRLGVHVGGTDLAGVAELAAQAEEHGADFVASVAPYYGEAPTVALVLRHLEEVAKAAPATPLCYYHIPGMTGSTHPPSEVTARGAAAIPTLRSVKFTDSDLLEYDRIRSLDGIEVFLGQDELLPAGLAFGARAVIGSLYNGLAPVAHQVTEAFDRGEHDLALELHRPFRDIASASGRHGGLGFVKEVMNRLGPDCGPPRNPYGPLAEADHDAVAALLPGLRTALEAAGETADEPSTA